MAIIKWWQYLDEPWEGQDYAQVRCMLMLGRGQSLSEIIIIITVTIIMSIILAILTSIMMITDMINSLTCHQLSRTGLLKTF